MSRFERDEIVEAWAPLEEHHSRSGASAARAAALSHHDSHRARSPFTSSGRSACGDVRHSLRPVISAADDAG